MNIKKIKEFFIKNKDIILRSIFVFVVLAITIFGLTYAWYSFTNPDIDVSGITSNWCSGLDVKASGGVITNASIGSPKAAYNSNNEDPSTSFTVVNRESRSVKIDILLIDVSMDSALKNEYFMYTLTDGTKKIAEGNFNNINSVNGGNITLKTNISLLGSKSKTYYLYLWIKDNGGDQNAMQNKTFSGRAKINISSNFCNSEPSIINFYDQQTEDKITVGDEIAIGTEHFYVVSVTPEKTVLLAKYNLYVGDIFYVDSNSDYHLYSTIQETDAGYGLQNKNAKALTSFIGPVEDGDEDNRIGTVAFSGTNYWDNSVCAYTGTNWNCTGASGLSSDYTGNYAGNPYPNVYNKDLSSTAPEYNYTGSYKFGRAQNNGYTIAYYVEDYINKLKNLGLTGIKGRLLLAEEAIELGCNSENCTNAPNWVDSSSYWLGSTTSATKIYGIYLNYGFSNGQFSNDASLGVRPVIEISTDKLYEDSGIEFTPSMEFISRANAEGVTTGDELAIDTEHFYVVSSDDDKTVLLSKYNLYVGDIFDVNGSNYTLNKTLSGSDSGYGLQNENAKGIIAGNSPKQYIGTVAFSGTNYWDNSVCASTGTSWNCTGGSGLLNEYAGSYNGNPYPNVYNKSLNGVAPEYNYDNGYSLAQNNGYTIAYYVEEYVNRLKGMGLTNIEGRLLLTEEANSMGCDSINRTCSNAPEWVYSTTYWLGAAETYLSVWNIVSDVNFSSGNYNSGYFNHGRDVGVRPVIVIPTADLYVKQYTLYSEITKDAVMDNISSTYVSSSTGIDFTARSSDTNGKGIYIRAGTENDSHPIYYYRGAVDNNNVLFANFCWKIVRTTDTGGIKLIYNGTPTDGKCTNTTGDNTQLSTTSKFNNNTNSPAYVGYMYGTPYTHISKSMSGDTNSYVYGNSVIYNNGTYTLTNTISGTYLSLYHGGLDNNHYTCFTTSNTCTNVYYLYYTGATSTAYYITLSNGKKVEDALSEMLDYNTTDSVIKSYIDDWYNSNMTSYTDNYIEDTIYCNDRSIYLKNGWNPNGGSTTSYLYFGAFGRTSNPIVTCPRDVDKFTVSSGIGNGELSYPVGLLTADEVRLAGGSSSNNSSYYLYTNNQYWPASPYFFHISSAFEYRVLSDGILNSSNVNNTNGVRPVVSLKPGTVVKSGNGTSDEPYMVE